MTCDELTNDVLADLGEGTLDGEAKIHAEAHLASCPACRRRAKEVRAILGEAAGWGAGGTLPARVEERLAAVAAEAAGRSRAAASPAAPARPSRRLRFLVPAAAALLGLIAGSQLGAIPGLRDLGLGASSSGRSALETRLREAEGRIDRMNASADRLAALARDAGTEAAAAFAERDRVAARGDALAVELRESRKTQGALEERMAATGEEVAALGESLAREKSRGDDAAALRDRLERQMEGLLADLTVQVERLEGLRGRFDAIEKERDELRGELGFASAEAAALKMRNEELAAALHVRGDADGDRVADVRDAMAICTRRASGKEVPFARSADLNGDGKVDVGDALLIAGEALRR